MAERVLEKLRVTQKVEEKRDFQETRKDIPCIASMDPAEAAELIAENPAYGTVICRCEKITEGEIIDAIRRPLGARSLDGIKRRTRAGMGRCQAGFCYTKVMEILARELGIPLEEVTKAGGDSRMLTGGEREWQKEEKAWKRPCPLSAADRQAWRQHWQPARQVWKIS